MPHHIDQMIESLNVIGNDRAVAESADLTQAMHGPIGAQEVPRWS